MAQFVTNYVTTQQALPPSPPNEYDMLPAKAAPLLAYQPVQNLMERSLSTGGTSTKRTNVMANQPYAGKQPEFVHVDPSQQQAFTQHFYSNLQPPSAYVQPRRGSTGTPFEPGPDFARDFPQRPSSPVYHSQHDTTLSALLWHAWQKLGKNGSSGPNVSLRGANDRSETDWMPSADSLRYAGLCLLWYMSSALSNNSGKSILAHFRYPVTLTLVQFGFVSVYCVLFCMLREWTSRAAIHSGGQSVHGHKARPSISVAMAKSLSTIGGGQGNHGRSTSFREDGLAAWGIRKPGKQALHGTLIMSVFQIAGHVFSSMAIARVPVSTVHTIKALSPLFTVLSYAFLFRIRYSFSTYISLIPLTLGVMLACSFDIRANAAGLVCALGSTIIFVSQNIFSKKLLPKDSESSRNLTGSSGKLDKVNLLLYSAGMAFLLMLPIWVYTDLHTQLQPKPTPANPISSSALFGLFVLNGSVHFAQCLLAFSILARSSPVAYSIASLIKRVAVIGMAIVWFGQQLRFLQACGMTMTFAGLYLYNRSKSDIDKGERKRGAFEKRNNLVLPSTTLDAQLMDNSRGTSPEPSPSVTPLPRDHSPAAIRPLQRPASPLQQHVDSTTLSRALGSTGLTARPTAPWAPAATAAQDGEARMRVDVKNLSTPPTSGVFPPGHQHR